MTTAAPPAERTTAQTTPVWFVRRPLDHRPALLQLPAATCWFAVGSDDGCWWRDVAWLPVGDHVVAVPMAGMPEVRPVPGGVLLRGGDGSALVRDGVLTWTPTASRCGADLAAHRAPWWSVPGLTLPDGARRARRLDVFPAGLGAVWADGGWLHRLRADGTVSIAGAIREQEHFVVGPGGSVLVGEEGWWLRAAAPQRSMTALPEPLAQAPGVRWSDDGTRVAGLSASDPGQGDAVAFSLLTGKVLGRRSGALTVTADRFTAPGDEDVPGQALLADDVRVGGPHIAGPGGRCFDVRTGAAVGPADGLDGDEPCDAVPCPARFEAIGLEEAVQVAGRTVLYSLDGHLVVLGQAD